MNCVESQRGRPHHGARRSRRGLIPGLLALTSLPLLLGATDVEPFPADPGFPSPIAGPANRGFGFSRVAVDHTTVDDTSDALYALKLGSMFPLVRVDEWRFSLDAGFLGLFDIDRSYDNLGWDGYYGFVATHPFGQNAAVRLAWLHDSSHVGDEYIERTGRMRIGYTREEFAVGATWSPAPAWRVYGEYGHGTGYDATRPGEPDRVQTGLEWDRGTGWAPYAAVDVQAYEERDWNPGFAVQTGLAYHANGRRWRLGLEYYDGRVPLGEFYREDLRHLSLGLYLDLGHIGPRP